jgi:hypothetical protein
MGNLAVPIICIVVPAVVIIAILIAIRICQHLNKKQK